MEIELYKMSSQLKEVVYYSLDAEESKIEMNPLLGKKISLTSR